MAEDVTIIQQRYTTENKIPAQGLLYDGEIAVSKDNDNPMIFFKKNDESIAIFSDKSYIDSLFKTLDAKIANAPIPKVFFNGNFTDMTKSNAQTVKIEYLDGANDFSCYCKMKWQGNSSTQYPKKNFSITLYEEDTLATKKAVNLGWGAQSKYCLKANYIDHSHARNIVSAEIWGEMVKSRSDFASLPSGLKESPNCGAIDGFPIKLYANGVYQGLYTWNVPKEGWMFGMTEGDGGNQMVVCGEGNNVSGGVMNYATEFRRQTTFADSDGEWVPEYPDEPSDTCKNSLNAFIDFVRLADESDFRTGFDAYADFQSFLDYYILAYLGCFIDSLGKNMIMATWDGAKWFASMYDMDSTWGLYWNGLSFNSPSLKCPEQYQENESLLWEKMEEYCYADIKTRYAELRQTVLSTTNLIYLFEKFIDRISKELYDEDGTIYTGIPSQDTNNIQQIRKFIVDRCAYVDGEIEAMAGSVLPTAITLSMTTTSFTSATVNLARYSTITFEPTDVNKKGYTFELPVESEELGITLSNSILNIPDTITADTTINVFVRSTADSAITSNVVSISVQHKNTDWDYNWDGSTNDYGTGITISGGTVEINTTNIGNTYAFTTSSNNTEAAIYTNTTDNPYVLEVDFGISGEDLSSALPKNFAIGTEVTFENSNCFPVQNGGTNLVVGNANKTNEYTSICALETGVMYTLRIERSSSTANTVNIYLNGELMLSEVTPTNWPKNSDKTYVTRTSHKIFGVRYNMSEKSIDLYGIKLNKSTLYFVSGGTTEQLTATLVPSSYTGVITWESSDETVATVSDGLVTALSDGTAIITAKCEDKSVTCEVTVNEPVFLNVSAVTALSGSKPVTPETIIDLREGAKGNNFYLAKGSETNLCLAHDEVTVEAEMVNILYSSSNKESNVIAISTPLSAGSAYYQTYGYHLYYFPATDTTLGRVQCRGAINYDSSYNDDNIGTDEISLPSGTTTVTLVFNKEGCFANGTNIAADTSLNGNATNIIETINSKTGLSIGSVDPYSPPAAKILSVKIEYDKYE